ncbi:argus isoform X2 [Haematobia irritans]|uniref:argus isoform X2 n=1 Tax=Haematobia irritans TaxID=7368 RepID=UPI003F50A262
MKEQHHQQHSLRMEQYQRNSKHASTSSSARGIVATPSTAGETTAAMATANQMRATLIYLAPFLHPCKNVVPGTKQQQQHQQQQKQHQQQQEMANILPHPRSSQLSLVQQYVEETLQQQTHVAHGGSRVAVMPVTGTRTSDSSIRSSSSSSTNNNRNVTTMSCASSTQSLLQKPEGDCSDGGGGGRNNHNNNAINCNSTFINASKGGRQHCCNISFSAIRSSCCHNNAAPERHDSELQKHKQLLLPYEHQTTTTKKDNPKHKDKFYENYEMPALETTNTTTTTSNTTTMLYTANNKIRQHNHHQQQQQQHNQEDQNDEGHLTVVVEKKPSETPKKIDNPSSSSSSLSLYPTMSGATMVPPPLNAGLKAQGPGGETSFVNYTNGRSTKYLRERGRRYFTIQQQQQQQLGHDSGRPLKNHEEFQLHDGHQQRTKSPCGLSVDPSSTPTMATCASGRLQGPLASFAPYAVIDNHNTAKCCNNNQMANTSLLSRCHCLNNMLSNGQDTGHKDHHDICDGKTWTWTSPDNGRLTNIGSDGGQHGHCHPSCTLRNSCCESCNQRETDIFSRLNENLSSAENCNALRAESGIAMTSSSLPLSSSSVCPLSSLYPASASSPASISTSYTTILNKECRCFKSKRDIIIDSSETQRNPSSSSLAVAAVVASLTSSTLGASESHKASSPSSSSSAFSACLAIDGCCTSARSRSGCRSSKDKDASSLLLEHSIDQATPSRILPSSAAVEVSPLSLACWFWQWCYWWLVALFGCSKLTKTVTVSKWLFMWLLLAVLSSSAHCWAGRNDVPTNCTFPARWEGSWFLSGYQQSIHIKGSQFSYRGRCAASDGNKYLIVDEKGCHRCLVIYEKHKNVLQYKESECEGDSMYMHQSNPSAMAMRSVINQKPSLGNGGDHRGGAHPNSNGHSRLSSSDQYIMRSNDDMNDYFCKGRETLQNLCDQIPGDALLYSLFRESADPVKCPLKGPFIFTYNRGNGECKSPVSNIESCTEDSRLLLSFQACPDVVGTESTVEELTCLATWKDGNSRYLVGLVSHHHAISNEERYRCFVYEKISSLMDMGHFAGPSMSTSKDAEYKLAQSGDATCNGLDSAEVGSRIMSLRKPPITERCDFPAWFKGPRHWHVLMGNAVYNYHTNDGSIHIIKPNGYMDTRALCEQINKQTATEMMSVVHYTTGCQSGFMCMMFYRRDTHIIEIQTGKPASRLEDACAPDHFDINKTPYITLLASNPDPQICPMEGLYTLRGAIGPPYMTTRHKRNHNNKVHGIHNHHHQYESNERGVLHRRHASLSFRNTNPNERNAWHSNTRGIPGRSRRDASSTTTKPNVTENTEPSQQNDGVTQAILVVGNNTNVGFVQDPDSDTRLRSRRNVPECITNYKAQRQLWIGCTEPNLIDVRPLCNDEGDEEYSCHGSWTENGTVYIIARHKGTKHGVCISYRPTEGNNAKLVVGDACYRGTQKPPEHHLEANLSVFGKCGETGSSTGRIFHLGRLQLMTVTLLNLLLSQLPIQR